MAFVNTCVVNKQQKNPQNFRCEGCETLVYFFTVTWFHYPLRAPMTDYRYQ